MRWSSCAAAPGASRTRAPPWSSCTTGLEAASQNRWPSLGFDLQAINGLFAPLFVAGFYYKTFMWPAAFWEKVYEPLIRRAAGLGRAALEARSRPLREELGALRRAGDRRRPGRTGGGADRGAHAARASSSPTRTSRSAAAASRSAATIDGAAGGTTGPRRSWRNCARMPDVRLLPRTTVFGVYDDGVYGAVERVNDHLAVPPQFEPRQRTVAHRRAQRACWRPARSSDRWCSATTTCRASCWPAPCALTSIATRCCPAGAPSSSPTTTMAGPRPRDLARCRNRGRGGRRSRASRSAWPPLARTLPDVRGDRRRSHRGARRAHRCRRVEVSDARRAVRDASIAISSRVSGGWSPTLHLTSHRGHRPRWDESRAMFVPGDLPPGMQVAGAANGDFDAARRAADRSPRRASRPPPRAGFSGPSMPALPHVERRNRRVANRSGA